MIAGTIIVAGALWLAAYCITAAGPVLYGLGPILAVGLLLYGCHVFTLNRRRRAWTKSKRRRGGFIL